MGVDIYGVQKSKHFVRRHTGSSNPYIKLLCKLYKFLSTRTKSAFNTTVYQRLLKSRRNRAPISLSRLAIVMRRKTVWMDPAKTKAPIAVIVGDVLDDIRLNKLGKIRVCALRFSRDARRRIEGAGGECITFDQLATIAPTGKNTFLLRGRRNGTEAVKHFGAAGIPGSHVKARVQNRGAETSRGRRPNKGYKRKAFKHI
jgi:large subunit ribosomal protein L18e